MGYRVRRREHADGGGCPVDWSWIVPPLSGSATALPHRYYHAPDENLRPAFVHRRSVRPVSLG